MDLKKVSIINMTSVTEILFKMYRRQETSLGRAISFGCHVSLTSYLSVKTQGTGTIGFSNLCYTGNVRITKL